MSLLLQESKQAMSDVLHPRFAGSELRSLTVKLPISIGPTALPKAGPPVTMDPATEYLLQLKMQSPGAIVETLEQMCNVDEEKEMCMALALQHHATSVVQTSASSMNLIGQPPA